MRRGKRERLCPRPFRRSIVSFESPATARRPALATPEYVETTTRRSPAASASGASVTVSPTVVALGLATMPRSRHVASVSGLTSGTTRATCSSNRKRLLRSITAAPACAATDAHSNASVGPAAYEAKSMPAEAPGWGGPPRQRRGRGRGGGAEGARLGRGLVACGQQAQHLAAGEPGRSDDRDAQVAH